MRGLFVVPVLAAVVVAAVVAVSSLLVEVEDGGLQRRDSGAVLEPTAVATATAQVQAGNVCQGIAARPPAGQPRVFSSHYTSQSEQNGIAIVAGSTVSERALEAARETIAHMFDSNDLEDVLVAEGAYVIITGARENILNLPEFRCLQNERVGSIVAHACGVADRADYPVVTVAERDLLGDRRGPCGGLNILYHELGHLVQGWSLDPQDYLDVKLYYQQALDAGKYRNDYAATNPNEYFAEGTQAYFLSSDPRGRNDRAWLADYDPDLFALLDRIYAAD